MAVLRGQAGRIFCVIAVGMMLAACDRCGDFWSPTRSQACKSDLPRQQ